MSVGMVFYCSLGRERKGRRGFRSRQRTDDEENEGGEKILIENLRNKQKYLRHCSICGWRCTFSRAVPSCKWSGIVVTNLPGLYFGLGLFSILSVNPWFLQKTDSLIYRVFKIKYFLNEVFLNVDLGKMSSFARRGIWEIKNLLS